MQPQEAQPLVTRRHIEQQLAQNRADLQEILEKEAVLAERRAYAEKQIEACKAGLEGFGWGYDFAQAEAVAIADRKKEARRTAREGGS